MHPKVQSSIIYNCQDMETYMSINRWMHKDVYTHTHTHTCTYTLALYSVIKNKILLFGATQKELKGTVLSGISQREKHKYCMISLTRGI